jgi:hypothetical protein
MNAVLYIIPKTAVSASNPKKMVIMDFTSFYCMKRSAQV